MTDKKSGSKHSFDKPGQVPPDQWCVATPFDSADFVADPLPVTPPKGGGTAMKPLKRVDAPTKEESDGR